MHVGGVGGLLRLLGTLASLLVLGGIGVLTYFAGRSAFGEVLAHGYGSTGSVHSRDFFNHYLRLMTVLISLIYALTLTGFAAEGIAVERARDTWLGLIATPMDGREIIRDKELGAIWRIRGVALLLVALWTAGLVAGAIHPLGFAAALVGLGVATRFFTALGTYGALRSRDLAGASNAALLPVVLLCLSGFLTVALPVPVRTVLVGAGSFPLVEMLALASYGEVRAGLSASPSPTLEGLEISGVEGASHVALAYALGVVGAAVAALVLARLAERQFDRLIGRPWRPGTRGSERATDETRIEHG
jgi:hypothetical protein